MKKNFLCFLSVIASLVIPEALVQAESPNARIEIVSFQRVSNNPENFTAEVCGLIHRSKQRTLGQADLIRLILDKEGQSPRVYYTYAGKTGIFCSLVVTLLGSVEATLEGTQSAKVVQAKLQKMEKGGMTSFE